MEGVDPTVVYVFESPIDAMSHATLERMRTGDREAFRRVTRLSLAGTAFLALEEYLKRCDMVQKVVVCLDNDEAGNKGFDSISRVNSLSSSEIERQLPEFKDFNEELVFINKLNCKREIADSSYDYHTMTS